MMDLRQLIALLTYLLSNVFNYQTKGNQFLTVLEDWVEEDEDFYVYSLRDLFNSGSFW